MATGPDRRVLLLAVGIPAAALLAVVGITVLDDDGQPRTTPSTPTTVTASVAEPAVDERWNAGLAEALEPLRSALPTYVAQVEAWSTGSLGSDQLARTLDQVDGVLVGVDAAVRGLGDHPVDELAGPLVADAVSLYRTAVDSHRAALAADDPDVRTQYDRLGRRLRILGDRVFDRARERTAAAVDPGEDVRLVLPAEVPDWSRLELSAGPPLAGESSDVAGEMPREREKQRPRQRADEWLAVVERLDVPTADDVREASGDLTQLGELARELVDAAEALRDVPVPDGDRGRADRVALGWLVLADAARAGQLAAVTGTGASLTDRLLELAARPGFRVA